MSDYPQPLQRLIDRLTAAIDDATDQLESGAIDADAWRDQLARELTRYHTAAYLAGQGSDRMDERGRAAVNAEVKAQLRFLNNFAVEIQSAEEFKQGWKARAEMYAEAIKAPYWKGATKMLPLPAMPTQGTQCLTRCGCRWDVQPVNEEQGDYDAYWRLGKAENCQTCAQRAADWSPLRIRGGELQ